MPENGSENLEKVIKYMKAHWPSEVWPKWQVKPLEYPEIADKVFKDFTKGKTKKRDFVRIAGLSGSGKTTQLLPAVEQLFYTKGEEPVLVAARKFVEYHPHVEEIKNYYGEENLRKKTDEFSTIMMFMVIMRLIKEGYDIILDVTLLDSSMEKILMDMLTAQKYNTLLLMIAASPEVTEQHLGGRGWRHTKATEQEFIRATRQALEFYAKNYGDARAIFWNVFDEDPIFDGAVKNSVETFEKYSSLTDIPPHDEDALREAKIAYLKNMI